MVLIFSSDAVIQVTAPCEDPLSQRPDDQCSLLKNLALALLWQRQCPESIQCFFEVARTRTRPVAAEQCFVRDLRQTRKVLEQLPGWNAADVQVHIGMTAYQEEGGVHPERAPAMGEHNLELRKINRYIVDVNRVSILVARAGKN